MSFQQEIDEAIKDRRLYFLGDRLPSDWYEGFRTWLPLAEAGDPKAQYNVGRCYSRGDGVEKDTDLAVEWLMKAAAQGESRSHFNLHWEFKQRNDEAKAAEWLAKAASLGEPRAVADVEKKASTEAVSKAAAFLGAGEVGKARGLFEELKRKGDSCGELGLVACGADLTVTRTTEVHHYDYIANVVTIGNNVTGGGTRTGTYHTHAIVFKAVNRSDKKLVVSAWATKYDYRNPARKLGNDERWDLPHLNPGETAERKVDLGITVGKERGEDDLPTIWLKGYTVWEDKIGGENWLYVKLEPKRVAWSFDDVKEERRRVRSGCLKFAVAAVVIGVAIRLVMH